VDLQPCTDATPGTIGAARHRTRVQAGRGHRLEQLAQPAPCAALDVGRATVEHLVHHAREHALVLAQR
jgi:hypothetical protein